ncbi:hypothetical protein ACWED2_46590, partial [Amycolatopsis sp. NPDC005003]
SLAGEIAGAAIDPFGYLMSSVASFLMEHVQPLKDMLDSVAGNPPVIQSYADTWGNVSKALGERKADFDNAVKNGTSGWSGEGAEAYRKFAAEHSEALSGAATVAGAISTVTMIMGQIVSFVRETVRQLIADLVGKLISWVMEEVFSLGFGTPVVVAQASAAIAKWGKKIGELLKKLTDTIRKVSPLLGKLVDIFGKIAKVFGKALGKVSGLDGLKVKEGGFVRKIPKEGGGPHTRAHGDGGSSGDGDGGSPGDSGSSRGDSDGPDSSPESAPGRDGSGSSTGDGSPSQAPDTSSSPGHAGTSRAGDSPSPARAGDNGPSAARAGDDTPTHTGDNSPAPTRAGDDTPSHGGDPTPSPTRAGDNAPPHAGDSSPSPTRAGDSTPAPTRAGENTPPHTGDSNPAPTHAGNNTPPHTGDSNPAPIRADDSNPAPGSSPGSHSGTDTPAGAAPPRAESTASASGTAPTAPRTGEPGTSFPSPRGGDGASSGIPPQSASPMSSGTSPGGTPGSPRTGGGAGWTGTPGTRTPHVDAPGRPRTGGELPRPRTPDAPAPAARGLHAPGARPHENGPGPHHNGPHDNRVAPHDGTPGHHDPDGATPHHDPLTPDEVNARHAESTPSGSSYHAGDPAMGDLPHRVHPDPDGRYTVDVHVTPDGHARIGNRLYTPEEFADILRRNGDYDGRPVRLIGCDAGSNDFAHRLSRELDTEVLAPTRPAWTDSHGRVFSSGYEIGPDGRMRPRIPPDGEWNTHRPDGTTHRAGDDGFVPGTHDAGKHDLDADDARARGDDDAAEAHKKKIHDELVKKLNRHDEDAKKLLAKYWEQAEGNDRIIRRKRTNAEHEGVELPVLRRNADGDYEIHQPADPRDNVPSEPKKGARWVGGRDSAPPELLEDADILAAGRPHIWSYLDEANHAVKGDFKPGSDFKPELDEFDQAGFNDVQSNHWNNKLGELAADHAVLDGLHQPEFVARPLERVDVPDRGAHHFDRVYKDADGNYVIVEAKGPSADLKGNGGYQQGHPEYVRNICAKMIARGEPEAAHAHKILEQLDSKKLRYFSVHAQVDKPDLSRYTDEQLRAMPAAERPADRYAGYVAKEYDLTITTKKPTSPPSADGA